MVYNCEVSMKEVSQ